MDKRRKKKTQAETLLPTTFFFFFFFFFFQQRKKTPQFANTHLPLEEQDAVHQWSRRQLVNDDVIAEQQFLCFHDEHESNNQPPPNSKIEEK
jgi:hypothetical protein